MEQATISTKYSDLVARAFAQPPGVVREPYSYQARLALGSWPDVLSVPTGMGKTAAVVLAWIWKRGWRAGGRVTEIDPGTPRRLVYCLPMRVLVEQTERSICQWLDNLGIRGAPGDGRVSVHVLMGGSDDLKTWAEYPEEDAILIGTQEMLLSRALMRGYGMSRYQWPIHFALLHNDALWVLDEVQLMGAALATSAQLEAFRREMPLAKPSRTMWVSATLNPEWLDTVDYHPHMAALTAHSIDDEDKRQGSHRLMAVKSLQRAPVALTEANGRKQAAAYLEQLRELVLDHHDARSQTLIIVNQVARAQRLFRMLRDARPDKHDLLIHGRFRATERAETARRLREEPDTDRIIVATQAIEAGVDLSSKVLVTELAPWASMVQRLGRCNRYGEHNQDGASILWLDINADADALPYTHELLEIARNKLETLDSASPQALPPADEARPLGLMLRRRDLLDLFNTDPDLSGFDVDVSGYIRDLGTPGVQVFWRDFKDTPNQSGPDGVPEGRPSRDELCPVSIGQAMAFAKRKGTTLWHWDALDEQWVKLGPHPRPGMTLLLRAADGGYDATLGFDAAQTAPVVPVLSAKAAVAEEGYTDDWRSRQPHAVVLAEHLAHVARCAAYMCASVDETSHRDQVVRAGRWHDVGKAHAVFQHSMYRCNDAIGEVMLAKSSCRGPLHHTRKFFRHELASVLAWLEQHEEEDDADLIAYLIGAHHGKVRLSLRAMPTEAAGNGVKRFARGIWEGDRLPALDFDGEHSDGVTLRLGLMEIGETEQGPSWTERTLKLLERHGPFQLAWLEALVRLADWRASAQEQQS